MRILHLDPDDVDNPLSGGGPVRTLEICQRLSLRHQITVLTPTFPGSTPERWRGAVRYLRLGRKIGDHGSSHHITFWLSLPAAIRRFDYDLLVEDMMPPCSVTLTPLVKKNKPLIASVQWFHAGLWRDQFKLPFDWLQDHGVRMYKNFIVLTESMRQRIDRLHPRARIEVIPNAVDQRLYGLTPEYGDFIFYLGALDVGIKGLDLLLLAYAQVPEEERLPLIMAGHGDAWPAIEAIIGQHGLAPWVQHIGKVGHEERNDLLRRCRFVCMPSRHETFGMTLLEGCAAGKPVAFFDAPPMNEIAPPDCPRAVAFESNSYAELLRHLLGMSSLELAELGGHCRSWALRFTWEEIAAKQERFYRDVAGG